MTPRWNKVLRDARVASGRLGAMVAAMALSIAGVTALLTGNSILGREIPRNYAGSHRASAILSLEGVDEAQVEAVRSRPDIAAAEAGAVLTARVHLRGDEWLPLELSVVPDFNASSIDTFTHQSGAWPPPTGSMLIERTGQALIESLEGRTLTVETVPGVRHQMRVAGLVHDTGKAPSSQEGALFGYITPATLDQLSGRKLDQLKFIVGDATDNTVAIEAVARSIALWLRDQGREVRRITLPSPGKHPHQWQYDSVLLVLLAFGVFGLLLEAVLMAIIVTGLLAPQVRQIAVMKAIGARTTQIAIMYLSLVAAIAFAALAIGLPLGIHAGHGLVDAVASILNLEIASHGASWQSITVSAALGLLLPLIAAYRPIMATARKTVKDSIDDHGVDRRTAGLRFTSRLLQVLRIRSAPMQLAIRNAIRRREKLILTVCLLSTAGAVFVASGNMLGVWKNVSAEAAEERRYDMRIYLRDAQNRQTLLEWVGGIAAVRSVEAVDSFTALVDRGDHLPVDVNGESALHLFSTRPDTPQLAIPIVEGRWLEADDADAIVLTRTARDALFPRLRLGEAVDLLVNARPLRLHVVGIARGAFAGPVGYATPQSLASVVETPDLTRSIRISIAANQSVPRVLSAITDVLGREHIDIGSVSTTESVARNEKAHTYVLMFVLGLVVLGVAVVGAVGLATALSAGVIERTREFGILRATGARTSQIVRIVVCEALFVGALSGAVAIALSAPLTLLIVKQLRSQTGLPLSLVFSSVAAISWLAMALLIAALAGIYPAKRAAGLTVRRALSFT